MQVNISKYVDEVFAGELLLFRRPGGPPSRVRIRQPANRRHCGMLRIVVFFCLSFVVPSSSSQLHRHRGLRGDLAARAIRARVTPDARKKTATSDGLMSLAWNCRYFLRFKAYCEMVEGLLSSSLRWAHAAGFHPSLPHLAEIHSLAYTAHQKSDLTGSCF